MLPSAADGATTPGKTGGQREAGVRFKAEWILGKSLTLQQRAMLYQRRYSNKIVISFVSLLIMTRNIIFILLL